MQLETKRLIIRHPNLEDASFLVRLLNEPSYIKGIRDSKVRTIADAEKYLTDVYFKGLAENGFGMNVVLEKNLGIPIGICGLVKRPGLEIPDLGFAVLTSQANRGYTQEAARAVLHHGREQLHLRKIAAIVNPDNVPSTKVVLKLGFKFINQVKLPGIETQLQYFELIVD